MERKKRGEGQERRIVPLPEREEAALAASAMRMKQRETQEAEDPAGRQEEKERQERQDERDKIIGEIDALSIEETGRGLTQRRLGDLQNIPIPQLKKKLEEEKQKKRAMKTS